MVFHDKFWISLYESNTDFVIIGLEIELLTLNSNHSRIFLIVFANFSLEIFLSLGSWQVEGELCTVSGLG